MVEKYLISAFAAVLTAIVMAVISFWATEAGRHNCRKEKYLLVDSRSSYLYRGGVPV